MSSKSIETELKDLRYKVRLLKESNKFETANSKNSQGLLHWERNLINGKISENKSECVTRQFTYDEEAFIVSNCYRKSVELVKKHVKEKKKKHKINSFDSIIHDCNENIFTNYTAELGNPPSFVKERDYNISHESKKCNSMSEYQVVNSQLQSNICANLQEKKKNTVRNKRDAKSLISKHTVDKYSDEFEVQIQDRNVNTETSTDVVFLKTVTHSREKKKKKSTKKTDKKELHCGTSNVSDKIKKSLQTNNYKELFEHTQKHTENNQKCSRDPDIEYLSTVNVSPSIITLKDINNKSKQIDDTSDKINFSNFDITNALQTISHQNNHISVFPNKCDPFSSLQTTKKTSEDSQYNEIYLSPELKTSVSLIDISSEEDEPETIVSAWDFTEEPVDFTIPALHVDENLVHFSDSKVRLLESKGIVIKKGRWSENETALLIRNYKDFVHRFGISDPRLLLGLNRFSNKHEYRNVLKFLRAKHFMARLGKDINHRPLQYIYDKARKIFDPLKYKRKNGKNNILFLLKLQKKYGNRWQLIAEKFGRSARYCSALYDENKKCYMKGKWSNEEIKNLIYAVKKVSKSSRISSENFKNISWKEVSKLVKTRSPTRCWLRWNHTQQKLEI